MKILLGRCLFLFLSCSALGCAALAGESLTLAPPSTNAAGVPRWKADLDFSYTFRSGFDDVGSYGKQAMERYYANVGYRFQLANQWYLRAGFLLERFDFEKAIGLLPDSLNKVAGVLALEYWSEGQAGLIVETRPGVYFENEITGSAFDLPSYAAIGYKVNDKLAFAVGAFGSILSNWHIYPLVGMIWNPTPSINVDFILPDPKVNFRLSEFWTLSAGGDFLGGAFRTDDSKDHRTNHAVITLDDYRVGATVSYGPRKGVVLQLAGGWDIARVFDYYHAGPRFQSNGAPYLQLRFTLDL